MNLEKNTGIKEEVKSNILGILSVLFPNAKIFLFGSRATGNYREFSDIDLAVDDKKIIPIEDIDQAKQVLRGLWIPYKIDLVDFNNISNEMKSLIIKDNIVWKH